MEHEWNGFIEQLQVEGSKLINLYQEMQELLRTWMEAEDVEEIKNILTKRETIFSAIESTHSKLDHIQRCMAYSANRQSFLLGSLQAELHPDTFNSLLDMYNCLERNISETNELNQRAVHQLELKKNDILDQINKLVHSKKVIRPYYGERIAEPRFIDRKK